MARLRLTRQHAHHAGAAHHFRQSTKYGAVVVRYVREQMNWRVALCVRRGHGDLTLQTPSFNTMGNTDDFAEQIRHIQTTVPKFRPLRHGYFRRFWCFSALPRQGR